jgi:hypothetical protein
LWLARASEAPRDQATALQRVLAINPDNEVAKRVLSERFPELAARSPHHEKITELLGDAVFADEWWRAEALYLDVLKLDPTQRDALDGLLNHYAEDSDWYKGVRLLNDLRANRQNDRTLTRRLIDFAILSRDTDLLRQQDDILLKHPSVTVDQLLRASEVFAKQFQFEVVAHLLRRASIMEPQNQTVLFGLMNAYEATNRHKDARAIRQQITDVDRKSSLGKRMMDHLLEEDPYVPLSMRRNTLVAVREAIGLALPIILLVFFDNGLSFLGADRLVGIALALAGGYLLVTATSSHEQAIWQAIIPDGIDDTLRYIIGGVGVLVLVAALYLSLRTSVQNANDLDTLNGEACLELAELLNDYYSLTENDLMQSDPCRWLREQFYPPGWEY